MTESELAFLRAFVKQRSGLNLGPEKRYLVETRLGPVRRERGFDSLSDLVQALVAGRDRDLGCAVVDAMTTHETTFFRDWMTFETLRDVVLPRLAAAPRPEPRLRAWSAATSTGQEAYSVAMLVSEVPAFAGIAVEILATDLSQSAIQRARAGLYTRFEVQRGLSARDLVAHFTETDGGWEIAPRLRQAVRFETGNLLDEAPRRERFDLVLCRNLLIYLDRPTKQNLLARLAASLAPGGVLCLGASETALGLCPDLAPDPDARGFFMRRADLHPEPPPSAVSVLSAPAVL